MMLADRRLRTIAACACLAATGCTTLREIPRAEYAQREKRERVVVRTREGLQYKFDYAQFGSDTLTGYRLRDTEGAFEEYHTMPIALDAVERLSVRKVSWFRTGLIGGGTLAAIVAGALSRRRGSTTVEEPPPEPPPIP